MEVKKGGKSINKRYWSLNRGKRKEKKNIDKRNRV